MDWDADTHGDRMDASARSVGDELGASTRDIEAALFDRIDAGDQAALAILYYRQTNILEFYASRYASRGSALYDEMVDTGFVALDKALANYDRTRDRHATFSSFCRMPINDHCKAIKKRAKDLDRYVDDRYEDE